MANRDIHIIKATGEIASFSEEKLSNSLRRSGASEGIISDVVKEVSAHIAEGMTTRKIHQLAYRLLKKKQRPAASKYSLKRAIMELGPTGFPFEKYISELFRGMGYAVMTDQVLKGKCVNHEVDIVAKKERTVSLVECKYHNSQGILCDVHVPLYVDSRFRDIAAAADHLHFNGWLVTNTKFTTDALAYGLCSGLNMLAWSYPQGGGIKDLADRQRAYPLTCLTTLTRREKNALVEKGLIVCKDVIDNPATLPEIGVNSPRLKYIMSEAVSIANAGF